MNLDADREAARLKRLITSPQFKKHAMQRMICFGVIFIIWVYINGGVFPIFLRQKIPMLKIGSDASILAYFPKTRNNGANIKWAHGVNTLDKLERALFSSDIHMVEADVMLRGQGTKNQELVPIMAKFPDTTSNVTFDDWLDDIIKASTKGIKLDFQAIDAVELTLQKMKDKKDVITVPVWLHANVLQGPLGEHPKVDPIRFIRIVKKMYPESTISLGWTTGSHTDLSQSGYTWNMVLDMYHLIHKMELEPPIVFTVRASFITNSVPQLKWLTDNARASVLVWQEPTDMDDGFHQSLMYISYRYPADFSYFDLSDEKLETFLLENRGDPALKLDPKVLIRDTVMFRPEAWVKMGFYIEAHSILPSSEAVVLSSRAVYMVTKAKYKPSSDVTLEGRVQFLNRKELKAEDGRTGLSIFLRSTSYMNYDKIKGIKCFIGVDGEIVVEGSHLPGKGFKESQRMTPGSQDCFRFSVVDARTAIEFTVSVQHDCFTLESAKRNDRVSAVMKVTVPNEDVGGLEMEHPFIVKLEDSKRTAVLDELTVKYKT